MALAASRSPPRAFAWKFCIGYPVGGEIRLVGFEHLPIGVVRDVVALVGGDMLLEVFIEGVDLLIDCGPAGVIGSSARYR